MLTHSWAHPMSATHAVTAVEPLETPVNELAGQPEHAASPVSALYVPTEQGVGVPPFEPVYPAFAAHAVTAVEPVVTPVNELAGQPVQDVAVSISVLYVPVPQSTHVISVPENTFGVPLLHVLVADSVLM